MFVKIAELFVIITKMFPLQASGVSRLLSHNGEAHGYNILIISFLKDSTLIKQSLIIYYNHLFINSWKSRTDLWDYTTAPFNRRLEFNPTTDHVNSKDIKELVLSCASALALCSLNVTICSNILHWEKQIMSSIDVI